MSNSVVVYSTRNTIWSRIKRFSSLILLLGVAVIVLGLTWWVLRAPTAVAPDTAQPALRAPTVIRPAAQTPSAPEPVAAPAASPVAALATTGAGQPLETSIQRVTLNRTTGFCVSRDSGLDNCTLGIYTDVSGVGRIRLPAFGRYPVADYRLSASDRPLFGEGISSRDIVFQGANIGTATIENKSGGSYAVSLRFDNCAQTARTDNYDFQLTFAPDGSGVRATSYWFMRGQTTEYRPG